MEDTETDLLTYAQTGQVNFVISAYESNAIPQTKGVANLAYITLPSFINLGSVSEISYYHLGDFSYTESGTTQSYVLNPVTYCLTIPKPSTNPDAAILYVETLFSPAGATTLESYGITPLNPGIVYGNDNSVPSPILPFTTPVNSTDSVLFAGG
jgi:molybdate/tungstate transport system substrate-binding protein